MNAVDDAMPGALSDAAARADADPEVHVMVHVMVLIMVLVGNRPAFCTGYDLATYAEEAGWKQAVRERDQGDQGTYDWTQDQPINPDK